MPFGQDTFLDEDGGQVTGEVNRRGVLDVLLVQPLEFFRVEYGGRGGDGL